MWLRRGSRARFNLTDGTTVEGVVQRRFNPFAWRLIRVSVQTPTGPTDAVGVFIVPKWRVTFIQLLHVELDVEGTEG